ncbi:MAG: hypothetical protein EOL90_08660 [Spartobacteria bacterium]|nr:hypothetical protein [Spartobacteria bacterium]
MKKNASSRRFAVAVALLLWSAASALALEFRDVEVQVEPNGSIRIPFADLEAAAVEPSDDIVIGGIVRRPSGTPGVGQVLFHADAFEYVAPPDFEGATAFEFSARSGETMAIGKVVVQIGATANKPEK